MSEEVASPDGSALSAGLGRCRTCKHWSPENKNYPAGDNRRLEGKGGQCGNEKLRESLGPSSYESDALVYPYYEGAETFWTGPDFGCVHWAAA